MAQEAEFEDSTHLHEADDLLQMALWTVYQHWSRLDRRSQLGAYARRVLLRSFLTERR